MLILVCETCRGSGLACPSKDLCPDCKGTGYPPGYTAPSAEEIRHCQRGLEWLQHAAYLMDPHPELSREQLLQEMARARRELLATITMLFHVKQP